LDLSRALHAASALTQGVVIGTILSTFPVLQTLDAAFFRPIGICHNAYLVIILGKMAAQPASGMLSRTQPCLTAAAGCLMVASGFWLLSTPAAHSSFDVVLSLFCIGAGSSLLTFPSASLYSQERCPSSARAHFTPAVVEFIGIYFLGVAGVSCLASVKFAGIVVRYCSRCSSHVSPRHSLLQAGTTSANSSADDAALFLRIVSCL
jgi:hypothetical protein